MNEQPTHIDLFSGIGGFALAFQREGFRTIGHAEVEPFACAVYHSHFPDSICFGGVQNVTRDSILERCGELPAVVTGGFPCQPHSLAGKRKASADDRDLWGECKRVLGDVRPRFALFENVGGLLTSERGLFYNRVLSDLAEIRFACLWQVVSAADVGAPHRRERVWMLCVNELAVGLADGNEPRLQGRRITGEPEITRGAQCDDQQPLRCGGDWPSRPGQPQFAWEPQRVVLADSQSGQSRQQAERERREDFERGSQAVGNSNAGRCEQCDTGQRTISIINTAGGQTQPALGSLPNGLSAAMVRAWPQVHNRVGQLKGYGNAIVPQVAQIFARAIRSQIV